MNLQEATIKKILEAKQIGTIYHYTNLIGLAGITYSNKLIGSYNRQCFTRRNDLLNANWSVYNTVKIIVDGNLLSEKYKIKPTNQTSNRMEAEERIYIKQIDDFSKYVLGIEISKNQAIKELEQSTNKNPDYWKEKDYSYKYIYGDSYNGYWNEDKYKYDVKVFYKDVINLCKITFKNVKEV